MGEHAQQPGELRVVRLDPRGRWVVVDKPTGMLSVPGKGPEKKGCAAASVASLFRHAAGPLIVHRLDMDTSGLLLFGLDAGSQRRLSGQFEARTVEKAYTALVEGIPGSQQGKVNLPMRADIDRRPYQVIDFDRGRPASTLWQLMSVETDRSRLRLIPETGRTHQLRLHMAEAGHPILGDVLYGLQPRTAESAPRLMLHAAELVFSDPTDGSRIYVVSTCPF